MDHGQNHRSLWQELDALVLAEVEALGAPRGRPAPAAAPPPSAPELQADVEIPPEESVSEVEAPPQNLELFDGEEQEVIARTSAWLRNKPNRDMIIDALWSAVAAHDADQEEPSVTEPKSEALAADA